MGVKGLYSYINRHCTENGNGMRRPLSYFENKTLIIDVSIYLYKFKYLDMDTETLFDDLIQYLLKFNIKVILVFDGSELTMNYKQNEHDTRRKQKETTKELIEGIDADLTKLKYTIDECEDPKSIAELLIIQKSLVDKKTELEKTITRVSQQERSNIYEHLENTYRNSVEFLYEKSEEADKMMSRIARKNNGAVIVMSDDTDMFLYGSPVVAMDYDHTNQTVNVYNLKTILKCLDMNIHEFIQTCVVTGTDFLSPFHENSPLPKISITQMFIKFNKFKEHNAKYAKKYAYKTINNNHYENFIDLMCFVYWKNSSFDKQKLNDKLWSIFDIYYRM